MIYRVVEPERGVFRVETPEGLLMDPLLGATVGDPARARAALDDVALALQIARNLGALLRPPEPEVIVPLTTATRWDGLVASARERVFLDAGSPPSEAIELAGVPYVRLSDRLKSIVGEAEAGAQGGG